MKVSEQKFKDLFFCFLLKKKKKKDLNDAFINTNLSNLDYKF